MNVQRYIRMAHASSVLVSLIVNALLIAALFTFITFQEAEEREVNTVMVIEPGERQDIEEIEKEMDPEDVVDPEDLDDLTEFTLDTPMNTDLDPNPEPVEPTTQTDVSNLTDLMSDISSPVQMTGLLVGRSSAGRSQALKQYGRGLGGVSEPAVLRALEWLRDHQKEDGAWSIEGKAHHKSNTGITGLALLAFLAHGETPASKDFGSTVAKGIRFLVEHQDASGIFQPAGSHTSYGHAMATYAIAEAFSLTDNVLLREPLERGLQVIVNGQFPNGGFTYDYKINDRNDLSVGAWQLQALKASRIALPDNAEIAERLQRAMDGMLAGSGAGKEGRGFHYSVKPGSTPRGTGDRESISAAGTLGLFLSGRGDSREAREAIDFIDAHADRDSLPEWGIDRIGQEGGGQIYFWYYAVQAFFQEDRTGSNFKAFYPSMVKALVQNQAPDGRWDDFTEKGKARGPVFSTSLAALGLMVTYRYLPTTQTENLSAPPAARPALESLEDAVQFEI